MKKELEGFLNLPDHFEELSNKGVKQVVSGRGHILSLLGEAIFFFFKKIRFDANAC
jgi:hypothetical protein